MHCSKSQDDVVHCCHIARGDGTVAILIAVENGAWIVVEQVVVNRSNIDT